MIQTFKERVDDIVAKYTNGIRNSFKYDIDWVKYILWTMICICSGMIVGMLITKLVYGITL